MFDSRQASRWLSVRGEHGAPTRHRRAASMRPRHEGRGRERPRPTLLGHDRLSEPRRSPTAGFALETHLAQPASILCREVARVKPDLSRANPSTDRISVEQYLTKVRGFAGALAELAAPPTVRHQAETSAAMVADLAFVGSRLFHPAFARRARRVLRSNGHHDALADFRSIRVRVLQRLG